MSTTLENSWYITNTESYFSNICNLTCLIRGKKGAAGGEWHRNNTNVLCPPLMFYDENILDCSVHNTFPFVNLET